MVPCKDLLVKEMRMRAGMLPMAVFLTLMEPINTLPPGGPPLIP